MPVKQANSYLSAYKALYGYPNKGSSRIVSPRGCNAVFGNHVPAPGEPGNVPCRTLVRKKRSGNAEKREQRAFYHWTQLQTDLRGNVMMIGNEGRRNPVQGAMLKALGMLPGASDLFISVPCGPFAGLFIEMKQNKKYTPSARRSDTWLRQEAFQARMRENGYCACFAFGMSHGITIVRWYTNMGIRKPEACLPEPPVWTPGILIA